MLKELEAGHYVLDTVTDELVTVEDYAARQEQKPIPLAIPLSSTVSGDDNVIIS